ncbi:MAG: Glycosyltransferase Gtf1 [Phycisphaerales bacterium]|nr:Glycosyltransferase Gtf1 [Phycisphaerales bacterium]
MATPAPVVISLARGLQTGGVTSWALRTAEVLAARGRPVCIILHREDSGAERLHPGLTDGGSSLIRFIDLSSAPPLASASGDLSPYLTAYRDVVRTLLAQALKPVLYIPTLLGDSFGLGAALSIADPESIRIIGWQHSPIPYDATVLARYEPVISGFVAVSDQIAATLRTAHPLRTPDIRTIYNGVPVPAACPPRPPAKDRPLTLIYAGRMENDLKRVTSLIAVSDALRQRGIDHRLTLVGDGPAAGDIDALIADPARRSRLRRLRPVAPDGVQRLLAEHDLFLLPSRVEGLSLSATEALAAGCVPILAATPSGSTTIVDHGATGLLVPLDPAAPDDQIARAFADAVEHAVTLGLPSLSKAAHARARRLFSLDAYGDALEHALDAAESSRPRRWPTDRPCAFSAVGATASGSGAVPPDGPARLRELLDRLTGRQVIIHGTGRHTLELAAVFAASPARIVAFTDDDPARHGRTLWNWPIIAPSAASRTGATDVVISSWMNQEQIWARRSVYESQGVSVHRLYG